MTHPTNVPLDEPHSQPVSPSKRRRRLHLPFIVLGVLLVAAGVAKALGLELGQSTEELGLKYDISATDHGTGRVTVTVTLADQGRLKPLSTVDLVIASKDGTGYVDLLVPLAAREADGKQIYSVHLQREWAERATIQLRTATLDGKQEPLTWYYHSIPLAKYLPPEAPKKD